MMKKEEEKKVKEFPAYNLAAKDEKKINLHVIDILSYFCVLCPPVFRDTEKAKNAKHLVSCLCFQHRVT